MFTINTDKSIHITRGDAAILAVSAVGSNNESYVFKEGDSVRLRVFEKGDFGSVILTKEVSVVAETTIVDIQISSDDTKIGSLINKPKDYWYEIELNPDTYPQTIIGYDNDGPKVFRLFPEGADTGA